MTEHCMHVTINVFFWFLHFVFSCHYLSPNFTVLFILYWLFDIFSPCSIQELHLSLNDYGCISLPSNVQYPNLKQLYICGNPFSSWNDVVLIGKIFPNLESLVMADTNISSIPDPSSWHHLFAHLQSLNFNNSPLSDWKDIDKLNHFQKLEDVRLLGLPLLDVSIFFQPFW